MLKCRKCNNTEKFYVTGIEHHSWEVDNNKQFVADAGCDDSTMSDDFCCAECDSYEIEDVKQ